MPKNGEGGGAANVLEIKDLTIDFVSVDGRLRIEYEGC